MAFAEWMATPLGRGLRVAVGALLIVASLVYENAVVQPREAALEEQLLRNAQMRREADEEWGTKKSP